MNLPGRWVVLAGSFLLTATSAASPQGGGANLDVELRGDSYFEAGSDESDSPRGQGWLILEPRYATDLSPRIVFSVRAVLATDTHGDISRHHVFDAEDRELLRSPLRFAQLSLKLDLGALDLEAGRQMLSWGRTDGVRPTDNLTPRDWTDPLEEERLSPWAVRANLEKGRWSGEAAVVARYAPSRLPVLGGRWFPAGPDSAANPLYPAVGPKTLELTYEWEEAVFPPTTLANSQYGVKGGHRGERAEWTLSFYRGFDDSPRVTATPGIPRLEAGVQPVIFTRRFPRLNVAGGDMVVLAGSWAFRGEAGYFHYTEGLDDGYLLYEAEAEWTRGNWSAILGYADVAGADLTGDLFSKPGAAPGQSAGVSSSLDQVFLPAAFLHLARVVPTEWEASLEAAVGVEHGDSLVRVSGSWPFNDHVRLGGELDILSGPQGTLFGRWRANDRLRLFLRLSF
jgi:hypothetical protein